jgi:hypothetical protein
MKKSVTIETTANNVSFISVITPWNRFPLEKLIFAQLVKKFSAFYRTRRFITVFTRWSHWPLS